MYTSKYYAIKSIDLARALKWLTGESYMIFDDVNNPKYKVYSFENTEKLHAALSELNILYKKYNY